MCRAIQKTQPVGSYVYPEPGAIGWGGLAGGSQPGQVAPPRFCTAVPCFPFAATCAPAIEGVTAGYGDEVIFADGSFIDGR